MIDKFTATAKQVGLELIDMSDGFAEKMQTWSDILTQNPDSITAGISAGFITKPSVASALEMVIDVQTPPNEAAVLRTWAIETKVGADKKEYFNNIQLTFTVEAQQAASLVARGGDTTREDIRLLLKSPTSQLARITLSNESSGDGAAQTNGERYDYTTSELDHNVNDAPKVMQVLQEVLPKLKQALADDPS